MQKAAAAPQQQINQLRINTIRTFRWCKSMADVTTLSQNAAQLQDELRRNGVAA